MKDLINNGIIQLNKEDKFIEEKTIVVLGIPRSGTTMMAKVLESLGVYMGQTKGVVKEDTRLSKLLEKEEDIKAFKNLVNNRNKKHKVWGWKRPEAFKYIKKFEEIIRNPHFIFIFRDPLAISLREQISMNIDFLAKMEECQKRYSKIIKYVSNTSYPCLLVSYEKATSKKGAFINSLGSFLDIEINNKIKNDAKSKIQLDDPNYLKNTRRKDKTIKGNVDTIINYKIRGWAMDSINHQSIYVNIEINKGLQNSKIFTLLANEFRPGLKKRGFGSGKFGFSLDLKKQKGLNLDENISIEIRTKNTSKVIHSEIIDKKINKKQFFFIHIPKTGGTSFRKILNRNFNSSEIYPNGAEMKSNNGYPSIKKIKNISTNERNNIYLLRGHYPFITGTLLGEETIYITMLRNPINRCISYLYHIKRKNPEKSIFEIFEEKKRASSNLQVRYFADKEIDNLDYFGNKEIGYKALEQAKKNIDRCNFVGINEEFDKSVELLRKMYAFNFDEIIKKNSGSYLIKDIEISLINKIKKYNQIDLELYKYAKLKYENLKIEFGIL